MDADVAHSHRLKLLAEDYWQTRLEEDPLLATLLGDKRFDGRLPDITPRGRERRERTYGSVVESCHSISPRRLSEEDGLTRTALIEDAGSLVEYSLCRLEEWSVDPLSGPQVELANVESYQASGSPSEGRAMVERWASMGPYLDDHIANLRRGAVGGRVAVRECVGKVIDELNGMVGLPESQAAFLRPLREAHEDWSEAERLEFTRGLTAAYRSSIKPALERYLTFLQEEILPRARPQERPGVAHIPGGYEDYRRLIRVHTSLDLTPEELHRTGLSEVSRINGEMAALGERLFGVKERKEVLRRLRSDPSLHFGTGDEVAEKAESALKRAKAAIPFWFGRLPKADCEVVRMEAHEEKHSTIAYYRPSAPDGSRPGRYYVNTSLPQTRPRYEAECLAFHESIPGHHLQIAIAQELEGLPEFRKNSGVTAFIEGWGLYTERLADEMGLYSSDLDRMGMLSMDAWRACRLVVDTGMHAFKWTREEAITFMLENSALAENNIVNEVDRYITWPAQALAYKTGQLEILGLRRMAKEKLGGSFDIKRFHDVLLGNGAIPLMALRQAVARYASAGT